MVVVDLMTNLYSMDGINFGKQVNGSFNQSLNRLSTGKSIVRAADAPAELAISSGLTGQIAGVNAALDNIQDTINLIRTADSALSQINDLQIRTRDLFVKASGSATMTHKTLEGIFNEVASLGNTIHQIAENTAFNGKRILNGSIRDVAIQVGAGNGADMNVRIDIPDIDDSTFSGSIPPPPPAYPYSDPVPPQFVSGAFASLIPVSDQRIANVVNVRQELGSAENRLVAIMADLNSQKIGMAQFNSDISDADLARDISHMTKMDIIRQSSSDAFRYSMKAPAAVRVLLSDFDTQLVGKSSLNKT